MKARKNWMKSRNHFPSIPERELMRILIEAGKKVGFGEFRKRKEEK